MSARTPRDREVGALRAAWRERARCHELLTADGVPPGELEWRIAYVLAQVRSERDPWSESTPTPPAAERREETTHGPTR